MTTQRRSQNTTTGGENNGLGFDLDSVLDQQIKAEATRRAYQNKPEVKEKRKEYQRMQQHKKAIARAAMKGDVSKLLELGLSQEQAEHAVAKAAEYATPTS